MELRRIEENRVQGLSVRTNNENEFTPGQGKIPGVWAAFDQAVPVNYQNGERVYGVYKNYESDHNGDFDVIACFDGKTAPQGVELKQVTIPAGKYLMFSQQGEMPQIAIDAWTEVWNYFVNSDAEHERLFTTDFEYYPHGNAIEVYIAVK